MTGDILGYRKEAGRHSMSAIWLGVQFGLAAAAASICQAESQTPQEGIQPFRAMGAEIELQPMLDYRARELRECGSDNIPAPTGQMMKTGVNCRAGARLAARSLANAPRFL
jgi:hypothetical protein